MPGVNLHDVGAHADAFRRTSEGRQRHEGFAHDVVRHPHAVVAKLVRQLDVLQGGAPIRARNEDGAKACHEAYGTATLESDSWLLRAGRAENRRLRVVPSGRSSLLTIRSATF